MRINIKNPVFDFLFWFFFIPFFANFCLAIDTITQGQEIRDDGGANSTLISQDEIFQLGFFSPGNSNLRYVGIWYYNLEVKPVVWVANRDNPLADQNGVFKIGSDRNLVILDGNNNIVWSSNVSIHSNNTVAAVLSESGNFILSSNETIGDTVKAYWQSFDHPTDTYLPGMRVLVSTSKGENHALTSWKSLNDPSMGRFSLGIDPFGAPQIVIWNGTRRMWRSGQWNGVVFTGVPSSTSVASYLYGFKLSQPGPDGSMFFTYLPSSSSQLLRFRVGWDGKEQKLEWDGRLKTWNVTQQEPANECELYNFCGDFGVCDVTTSPKCRCSRGFQPKFLDQWNRENWSGGCERKIELQCRTNVTNAEQDGFVESRCMKLPDFGLVVPLMDSETCKGKCLANCSCNAYAVVTNIGCMMWTGDLIDVQDFHSDRGGNVFNLRLPQSELGTNSGKKISNAVIAVIVVLGVCFLCIIIWLVWRFKRNLKGKVSNSIPMYSESTGKEFSTDLSVKPELFLDGSPVDGPDLPVFNFSCVAAATNNFSEENKLGQGGFGPVYKGELPGGQEIAVKRLAVKSGQGLEEFKTEIILIAKLQHRNLVRLLGCSIQGEEKILLYEYMPNKSLDGFLFDKTKQALLDWKKRFDIIGGIARGLVYLHRDSRLRIIHRDLKASNILLDAEMNPKISDFGMARMFGRNQDEANTVRVVGTYGYMSPEYAMEGLFSIKSDVYSFGVLLLEIVSGRRNTSFRSSDHTSIIGYAWDLWKENKPMELIDSSISDTMNLAEVQKCIHVGMLCVQDSAALRPKMESVVLMLDSDAPTLPVPKQPTYSSARGSIDTDFYLDSQDAVSSNNVTVTMVSGR